MTTTLEASYQPLQAFGSDGDVEETPHDSGVMIHVVPESSRGERTLLRNLVCNYFLFITKLNVKEHFVSMHSYIYGSFNLKLLPDK